MDDFAVRCLHKCGRNENRTLLVDAADALARLRKTMKMIARGRTDCGRPLAGEIARNEARMALIDIDDDWQKSERAPFDDYQENCVGCGGGNP